MELLDKINHPPTGASADWTIPQRFEGYGEAEHRIWVTLYDRQAQILPGAPATPSCMGLTRLISMGPASLISVA